jgi:histidine triad (HIT) family protein
MDCVFCNIVAGKIPSDIVFQDDEVMAFRDIHPKAPTHLLIIPRKHIVSLAELTPTEMPLAARMIETANELARQEGVSSGYRLVINTGKSAGQVVMHLHMHLLGGRPLED